MPGYRKVMDDEDRGVYEKAAKRQMNINHGKSNSAATSGGMLNSLAQNALMDPETESDGPSVILEEAVEAEKGVQQEAQSSQKAEMVPLNGTDGSAAETPEQTTIGRQKHNEDNMADPSRNASLPQHTKKRTLGSTPDKSEAINAQPQRGSSAKHPTARPGADSSSYRVGFPELDQTVTDRIQQAFDNASSLLEQFDMMKSNFSYFKKELNAIVHENVNGVRLEARGAFEQ